MVPPTEIQADVLRMDEVAVAATLALPLRVLTALGFPEVGDWTVLDLDRIAIVVLPGHGPEYSFCLFLGGELDVEVADHVLSDVVCNDHVQDLTLLAEFEEDFFEKLFKVMGSLDELLLWSLNTLRKGYSCSRIRINVREEQRLGKWGLIVLSCTTVAVTTSSYLIVKWAINFIVLRSELLCESVSHFGACFKIIYFD